MELQDQIKHWTKLLENKSAEEVLTFFIAHFKDKVALSSSLSIEDQVITHMIQTIDRYTRIFTLDTGRLFPETYSLIDRTNDRYNIFIEVFFPDYTRVETMVNRKGMNLFYENIENRKECCNIRKIEPLKRAFKGLDAWICGLRRDQSVTRTDMEVVEWDANNNLVKINPLIHWTEQMVWAYIKENNIPYNILCDKGYSSIGCQPCTRAIKPGEDVRAGRWWWENPEQKECGLHARRQD